MSGSDSPTFFHGQPWSSWIERIGRDKPLSDEESDTQPSSSVTRLSVEDIDLYGFCPERDTFYGVVCEICDAIVKPQALIQHMESRHPSGTANFPPPATPTTKPSMKTPYCKLSKLKKTTQSSPSPSNLPSSSSPSAASLSSSSSSSTSASASALSLSSSSSSLSSSSTSSSSSSSSSSSTTTISTSTASSSIPIAGTKLNHPIVKRPTDQTTLSVAGTLSISSSPRSPLESIPVQSSTTSCNVAGPSSITVAPTSSGSPGKSPAASGNGSTGGQPRRKRLKTDRSLLKDREYDPDRHCGVWNEETGKPCTRSLTCKAHTVSLRRTVAGRSKTFDKLLAEHRAAKEQPNSGGSSRQTTKVTVTGAVTVSSAVASSLNNPHAPNTPVSIVEPEAPSSPPVLSLPDTYPLPKAVDLLYRCLAPHGSTKPTKLEEDFANAEDLRSLESTLVVNSSIAGGSVSQQQQPQQHQQQQQSVSMMTPTSVLLPSLSPLASVNSEESPVAALLPSITATSAMPVVPAPLPATCVQPPTVVATVLEGETPVDIDTEAISMYSSVYAAAKDAKSQLVMQMQPRANSISQSSVSSRSYQQIQASMPNLSLFEPMEQLEQQHASQINGKRLNHASPVTSRQQKRHKQHVDLSTLCQSQSQDFSTSASIQVEATTTSSPYPHFSDISWSNCHPEPLAVSRWLRISSSRKQYNFNIH